jgi:glycosyltransferase involved in cell wall biosynthesis
MKIVHVVIDGEIGGGQLVALRLATGAVSRGHQALIVSPSEGAFTRLARNEGIDVHIADVSRLHRLAGLAKLIRLIRVEHVDVVHTHGMIAVNVLSRVAARLGRAAVVSHIHTTEVFRRNPILARTYRALDRGTARWCKKLIAVSEFTRAQAIDDGVAPERVVTIHNGIDVGPPPVPVALGPAPLAVCVGRLEPAKGQETVLRALSSVPGLTVAFVGRDVAGRRRFLEELAATLGVAARVIFTGPRDDVLAVLAGSDLLVQASRAEAFPVVPLEAMAAGLPVVATDVGGTRELVANGETGVLVPPGDANALAAALTELTGDGERARALGAAGRRRVEAHFSAEQMVERVLAVYE